jgi:pseudaminic acid synthase
MSANHNHSLVRAIEIVEAAHRAGAHAVKLQTYTAGTLTLDVAQQEFLISDPTSPWKGKTLHGLYEEAATPWDWHKEVFKRCSELGLVCFSTPFDETAVDFLETLDVPCYKIASFETVHLPLLRKVASTRKPLIISTGMASIAELDEMVRAVRGAGCTELILLKCTSSYPATPSDSNLRTIPHLRQLFDCHVGLSDHTMGLGVAAAAVAFGACLVEKHITLSRDEKGPDSAFSAEPEELRALVVETRRAWEGLGKVSYGPTKNESKSLQFRRSLYIASDMKAGDPLTKENMRIVRPGFGLPPKFYDIILGRRIVKDARKGTPVTWDLI